VAHEQHKEIKSNFKPDPRTTICNWFIIIMLHIPVASGVHRSAWYR
jgi:hypothetical protein